MSNLHYRIPIESLSVTHHVAVDVSFIKRKEMFGHVLHDNSHSIRCAKVRSQEGQDLF